MSMPYGFAFRVNWRGKVILRTIKRIPLGCRGDFERVWVDAKSADLDKLYREKGDQG